MFQCWIGRCGSSAFRRLQQPTIGCSGVPSVRSYLALSCGLHWLCCSAWIMAVEVNSHQSSRHPQALTVRCICNLAFAILYVTTCCLGRIPGWLQHGAEMNFMCAVSCFDRRSMHSLYIEHCILITLVYFVLIWGPVVLQFTWLLLTNFDAFLLERLSYQACNSGHLTLANLVHMWSVFCYCQLFAHVLLLHDDFTLMYYAILPI